MKRKIAFVVILCLCTITVNGTSPSGAADDMLDTETMSTAEPVSTPTLDNDMSTEPPMPTPASSALPETADSLETESETAPPIEPEADSEPVMMAAEYFSGSGTKADPYRIDTESDLRLLAETVNAGETYAGITFILTANITLTEPWTPIGAAQAGNITAPFKGTFDGGKHTVSNLQSAEDAAGFALFGCIQDGAVHDLGVAGAISVSSYSAALVAYAENASIYNCRSEAEITAAGQFVGGIAGYLKNSFLEASCNKGEIIGTASGVGGLAGAAQEGIIRDCYNSGSITGSSNISGIVGWTNDTAVRRSTITACYSYGTIMAVSFPTSGSAIANGPVGASMENNYYLTGSAVSGAFGKDSAAAMPVAQEEMCTENFAGQLSSSYICLPNINHGYPELQAFTVWEEASPQELVIEELPTASTITYRQTLSKSKLTGGKVAGTTGTWAWAEPDLKPNAGTAEFAVVFTPDSGEYAPITAAVTLTVNKYRIDPNFTDRAVLPLCGTLIYGQALGSLALVDGFVDGVSGVWVWVTPSLRPDAGMKLQEVVYIPADQANFEPFYETVYVTVYKATPIVSEVYAASITYGQQLGMAMIEGKAVLPLS